MTVKRSVGVQEMCRITDAHSKRQLPMEGKGIEGINTHVYKYKHSNTRWYTKRNFFGWVKLMITNFYFYQGSSFSHLFFPFLVICLLRGKKCVFFWKWRWKRCRSSIKWSSMTSFTEKYAHESLTSTFFFAHDIPSSLVLNPHLFMTVSHVCSDALLTWLTLI